MPLQVYHKPDIRTPSSGSYAEKQNLVFVGEKCPYLKETYRLKIRKSFEDLNFEDKDKLNVLPKTKILCPKCGNNEAFWILRQMRGSDEPESRFYTCTKCGHKWRED